MKKVTNVTISEEVDRAVDSSHFPPIYLPLPYPLAPASLPTYSRVPAPCPHPHIRKV